MKLYFAPGSCSLSSHIVALEAGIPLTLMKVDTSAKKVEDGSDYLAINPKGYVPALQLDNGEVLTENPAILQYLADSKPDAKLVPASSTFERYRLQEMLGYINSEIHKSYSPLLEQRLAKQPYLLGEQFTVADAYLFVVTSWARFARFDLSEFPNLLAFQAR